MRLSAALAELQDLRSPRKVAVISDVGDSEALKSIRCPDLRFIAETWSNLPRPEGEPLPNWSEFQPADLRTVLPKLCVIKVDDWDHDAFEFSLYGGHPTEFVGRGNPLDLDKMRSGDDPCENYADIRDRLGRAIRHSQPQYARKAIAWNEAGYVDYEVLMLPFSAEDGVQRVLQPLSARLECDEPFPDAERQLELLNGTETRNLMHAHACANYTSLRDTMICRSPREAANQDITSGLQDNQQSECA